MEATTGDSITQPKDSVNRKYSISEENSSDTAYLSAVERGDMEMAQRMVDEGTHNHRDGRSRPSENEMGEEKERPESRRSFGFQLDQITRTRSTASRAFRSGSTEAGTLPVTSKMV